MKKILIMIFCTVGLFGCSNQKSQVTVTMTQATEEQTINSTSEDVMDFDFGSTLDEVKMSKESKPIAENETRLAYKEEFAGYNTLFLYVFNVDKKLESMMINFTDEYSTKEETEERFQILKTALTSIYGDFTLGDNEHGYMWDCNNEQILLKMEDNGETVILFSNK